MLIYRWKGSKLEVFKLLFVFWCLLPIEYNGSDLIFDNCLRPLFTTTDKILFAIAKKAAPYLISCVKVTKEIKGELPEIVEICSYRFKETFHTFKQLIDLLLSKVVEQEVKPRLFSDIYKDFIKSFYV